MSNGNFPENTTLPDTPADQMKVTMPYRNCNKSSNDKIPKRPNSLQFNIASIHENVSESGFGSIVDNGAPYSAIGCDQLFEPAPKIKSDWIGELNDVSDEFLDCPYWQDGIGDHASESHKNIGSTYLTAKVSDELSISISFFVLQGLS